MYQMQKENLELKLLDLPRGAGKETVNSYQEKIADYKKKIEKYEQEKTEIQEKAKVLEGVRDEAQQHSKAFGMAIIFLQIAILLSSISGLMKKKPVWYAGLATGIVGLFFFVNGFLVIL
jgi:K+/H+ antiporter YhaU regulatory subunit KhtT